jgi:hypothetical protein
MASTLSGSNVSEQAKEIPRIRYTGAFIVVRFIDFRLAREFSAPAVLRKATEKRAIVKSRICNGDGIPAHCSSNCLFKATFSGTGTPLFAY